MGGYCRSVSKVIVITGCSTGFGREAALRFAKRGDTVFATMRGANGKNADKAASLLAEGSGTSLSVVDLDVVDEASVNVAAQKIVSQAGAPDVVINNAGVMYLGINEAFTADEFTHQLDVNVVGVHRVCRAFLPSMRAAQRGLFINVTSVAGRLSGAGFGIYCASKWALEAYTLAQRIELASSGIDAVTVEPGPFKTELFGQAPSPTDADGRAATYPPELLAALEAQGQSFADLFANPELPTDASLVVDKFVELVDQKAGTRALRHAVGLDFGVSEFNKQAAEFDASVLEAMGMATVGTLKG